MDNRDQHNVTDEQLLEPIIRDMRAMVPPGRDAAARTVRRQRLVRILRERVAFERARRHRFQAWRWTGITLMTLGSAAAVAVLAVRAREAPPAEVATTRAGAEMGVGIGVVKGSLRLDHNGQDGQKGAGRGLAAGEDVVVGVGDALETSETGGAQLMLSDLASLTLSPATRVADISSQAGHVERIRLSKGKAHLWVSKLRAGRRFHVITPDAEIQVRGTEFDVELGTGPRPRTCVRVQEGLVLVTSGSTRELLEAGRSWGCEPITVEAAPVPAVVEQPPRVTRPAAVRKAAVTAKKTADLKIQNALFQRALRAERAGRYDAAGEAYRILLERYPNGPLSAQAEANLSAMPGAE